MKLYVLGLCCVCSLCLAVNLPWSAGGVIESDLTITHPEKFTQSRLISQYLDKVESYLNDILKDSSLNVAAIQAQIRDAGKAQALYDKIQLKKRFLTNIKERLVQFIQRLKLESGLHLYNVYKSNYFKQISGIKDKQSDPFNMLKIGPADIEQNRDCLYRFLAWQFPGQKTPAQIKAMSYADICKEIDSIMQQAASKGLASSPFFFLMREIRTFFDNELTKEQYDAFVDGVEACNRLIIQEPAVKQNLLERANLINNEAYVNARMKVLEAEETLGKIRSALGGAPSSLQAEKKAFDSLVDVSFTKGSLASQARKTQRYTELHQIAAVMMQSVMIKIENAQQLGIIEPNYFDLNNLKERLGNLIIGGKNNQEVMNAAKYATNTFNIKFESLLNEAFKSNVEMVLKGKPSIIQDHLTFYLRQWGGLANVPFAIFIQRLQGITSQDVRNALLTIKPNQDQFIKALQKSLEDFNFYYNQIFNSILAINPNTVPAVPRAPITLESLRP